ncbi:MAG: peptidylprolyl isomerase, partial [Pseudomonadota bacterium]
KREFLAKSLLPAGLCLGAGSLAAWGVTGLMVICASCRSSASAGSKARIGLNPSPDGVAGGYDDVASSIEVATPELRTLLSNQGITEQAMDDFVAANVVWRSLVRSRFAARIEPGEAEIDSEIALSAAVRGVDYRLQEIGLPSDDAGRSAGETLALAERLRREIDSAEAFSQAARQLSRAPSAEVGGELGWVSGEALPPE